MREEMNRLRPSFMSALLMAVAIVALLTSCREPSMDDWTIHVGIKNNGTNMLESASVSWGEFWFRAGFVPPSVEA